MKLKRADFWNYDENGVYFVTLICKNRERCFGEIKAGKMNLSTQGLIANQTWKEIPNQYSFVSIDESIVMPDHFHGILIINKGKTAIQKSSQKSNRTGGITGISNPMLHKNLSTVVRWFKGRVCYEIRKLNPSFSWQSGFHDRIILNKLQLYRIRKYIQNNPQKWMDD